MTQMENKTVSLDRILVVDDEEFCLFSMKALLILSGIDVANRVDFVFGG